MTIQAQTRHEPALSEQAAHQSARLLQALADPTRLGILSLLSKYAGTMTVEEITSCFPLCQPTISHHLRILRDAGVIDCRKTGLYCCYYIERMRLLQAQEVIENVLRGG